MPEQFTFKRKLMHQASELGLVDKGLQGRAEWVIKETGIEEYLKKGGLYLDIGTGKGHIIGKFLQDMEKESKPLAGFYGIDIMDKPLKKVQKREAARRQKEWNQGKNPIGFMWATAENLPVKDKSLDGISYFFSIHHMEKDRIDQAIDEAKRVLKDDGLIFIVEDLVEDEEEKKITESVDRKLNWEGREVEHNYKSDSDWQDYFKEKDLEIVEKKYFESASKKGPIRHASYILKNKI